MKNQIGRRGALWFWSGIILFSVSAPIWLIFIVMTAVDHVSGGLEGVLILSIPVGLSIYCVNRGKKSVSVEWPQGDKNNAGSALGAALIAIGVWGAIILLPTILNSFSLFALIGGPGVLIGHKLKRVRFVFLLGLGVAAWGYAVVTVCIVCRTFNNALLIDSLKTVVPPAVLGTLALAWLGRRKLSPDSNTLSAFLKFAPFTLLVISPFIIGGLHDYNRRWDTSPPQVIELKVVEKWIDYRGEDWTEHYMLKGETLDGKTWFSCDVSETFYSDHVIGSLYSIRVLSGALGYLWLDQTSVR